MKLLAVFIIIFMELCMQVVWLLLGFFGGGIFFFGGGRFCIQICLIKKYYEVVLSVKFILNKMYCEPNPSYNVIQV